MIVKMMAMMAVMVEIAMATLVIMITVTDTMMLVKIDKVVTTITANEAREQLHQYQVARTYLPHSEESRAS